MEFQKNNYSLSDESLPGSSDQTGAAKMRILDSVLNSLYGPVMHTWLKNRLDLVNLNPNSQSGDKDYDHTLLLLRSLSNESISLETIDETSLSAEFKDQTIWLKGLFPTGNRYEQESGELPVIIYLRIWDTNRQDTAAVLQHICKRLKTGGLLALEIIRFSGFTAYPYHYSFSGAVDLIAQQEVNKVVSGKWPELLHQTGFSILDSIYSSSAFLPRQYNRIISYCLEIFRSTILRRTVGVVEELDALLPLLKQFEEQKDTLICRPGVHLLLALKI